MPNKESKIYKKLEKFKKEYSNLNMEFGPVINNQNDDDVTLT